MNNKSKKLLKRFTASLSDYCVNNRFFSDDEINIFNEMWNAVRCCDFAAIAYFKSCGEDIRHIIMNVAEYRKGLQFGFDTFTFGEYGWIKKPVWPVKEEINFRVKEDNACCNYITLACGINGSWTYGYTINYGCAGSSSGVSVFGDIFTSKNDCLKAALRYMKAHFEDAVTRKVLYCRNFAKFLPPKAHFFQKNAKNFSKEMRINFKFITNHARKTDTR